MGEMDAAGYWSEMEFGGAVLGDARRSRRLEMIAAALAAEPGRSISTTCGKSGAQSVSRLLGREEVTLESVTEAHRKQTRHRCGEYGRVLAIQDTTVLDFTTHDCLEGIGPVSQSKRSRGLLMHTVLTLNAEKTPLGICGLQVWARDESERGCAKDRRKRPVSAKESNKWLVGLRQAEECVDEDVALLVIGDRESDIYALFVAPRRANTELLARLAHNRVVQDSEQRYVMDAVKRAEVIGSYLLDVPRQGSRAARQAHLDVRVASVTLRPPQNGVDDLADTSVNVWVVDAVESNEPQGVQPLSWTLLTTQRVDTLKEALEMIQAYGARWVIEEFHHVLKSGCRVEQMQFDCTDRMLPAIGLNAVVAWRVLHVTKYSREHGENPVESVATHDEIEVLSRWLRRQGDKNHAIRTAREFCIAVARLGGFLGRKSDGMPGTKTTWQGLRKLETLVAGYLLARQTEM